MKRHFAISATPNIIAKVARFIVLCKNNAKMRRYSSQIRAFRHIYVTYAVF